VPQNVIEIELRLWLTNGNTAPANGSTTLTMMAGKLAHWMGKGRSRLAK